MEFWEFLIQREGDRSWLPLESPDVEVLEGRYRMVARTSRTNQPVEIRISHISLDEQPPRRLTQKRQGQVNPDGLIVVFPFTRLQPGVWELSCAGDLMADMMGQGWRYAVQLSVLRHESDVADDWEPDMPLGESDRPMLTLVPGPAPLEDPANPFSAADLDDPADGAIASSDASPEQVSAASEVVPDATAASGVQPVPAISAEAPPPAHDLWQQAQADSDALMDALLDDLDLDVESPVIAPEPIASDVSTPEPEEAEPPPGPTLKPESLQLVLHQSSLMVQPDQSLTLQGVVEPVGELEIPYLPPVALQITLRDPQTAKTVLEVRRSLVSRLLPCPFSCKVTLTDPPESRLLLGEVALVTLATPANDPVVLTSAGFTATASLHELLEAIADDFPAELYPPLREDEQPVDLDLTFLIAQRAASAPLVRPSGQQVLPPQLYQPDPNRPRSKGIELPMAKAPEPEPMPDMSPVEAEESNPEVLVEMDRDAAIAPPASIAPLDPPDQPETLSRLLEEADVVLQHLETVEDGVEDAPNPDLDSHLALSAEELAFRALDLQNRFLSRLNSLAGDRELSQFLGSSPIAPSDESWDEQEIVADDEVPLPPLRSSIRFQTPSPKSLQDTDLPYTSEEETLPIPELRISSGELVSGQRVDVTVVLPSTAARLGVKLWMQDMQNRALLDGPRWVMNFLPNGQGQLEAWSKMTVPHGCLEVQFEAIAVELTTQRESHKATVDRSVVPPDLPSLSFDELEI